MDIKKLYSIVTLTAFLMVGSCTSKDTSQDGTEASTEEVDEQLAQIEDVPTSDEESAGFSQDSLESPEQSLGEQPPEAEVAGSTDETQEGQTQADQAPMGDTVTNDNASTDQPMGEMPTEQSAVLSEPTFNDTPQDLTSPPPAEELASSPSESFTQPLSEPEQMGSQDVSPLSEPTTMAAVDSGSSGLSQESAPVAPKPNISLEKIKDSPFKRGGFLLNGVYIARSGDTYKSIAAKIYSDEGRAKDLKAMNPSISKPKVGHKIYFNSPVRPQDETSLKVFYEDSGMQPQVYVAKENEKLRPLAEKLLGHKDSWKEIWSTNRNVDSKYEILAGTELYYWPSSTDIQLPPVAAASEQMQPPQALPAEMSPPSAPSELGQNEFAPPPSAPQESVPTMPEAQAQMDLPPPPPPMEQPPQMDMPPPPPIEQQAQNTMQNENGGDSMMSGEEAQSDDTMMLLGAIGVLSAAGAGLIVLRKRKQQKASAMNVVSDHTHIGTGA